MKKNLQIFLSALCLCAFTYKATAQFSGGNGSENNPYIITTAAQLAQLATLVNAGDANYNNKFYQLGNHIDLSNYGSNFNNGKGWIPIGKYVDETTNYAFKGNFDGSGYVVQNLYINDESAGRVGLFGSVENGTLTSIVVSDANVNAGYRAGALAGYVVNNSYVKFCTSSGTVKCKIDPSGSASASHAGGLIGYAGYYGEYQGPWGKISGCTSSCNVSSTGNQTGGLVGTKSYISMDHCDAHGIVSGESTIGGLVGYNYEGSTSNCYSTGKVNGKENIGGIAGRVDQSSISNCYSSGEVVGSLYNIGGIAGVITDSNISNSYCTGNVSSNNNSGDIVLHVGGIAGRIEYSSKISYSFFTGNVSYTGTYFSNVGGIAGGVYSNCSISNCYSSGIVDGGGEAQGVGGIAGCLVSNNIVSNCYSISTINGYHFVGGVVGEGNSSTKISNCVALNPSVKATYGLVGRIVGTFTSDITLSNNAAWDGILNKEGTTIWNNKGANKQDGVDMTAQSINTEGTLGGRFTSAEGWTIQNGKLPGLNGNPVNMPPHLISNNFSGGNGTPANPYIITTDDELAKMASLVNEGSLNEYQDKHYKLRNDIDLSTYQFGEGWIPIGLAEIGGFRGNFNGNNKKITGLYMFTGTYYAGLFGVLQEGGTITNLGVENVNVWGVSFSIGGLVGWINENCVVSNCYVTGIISGNRDEGYVGGITGVNSGTVEKCYFSGEIEVRSEKGTGGIAGFCYDGSILNCYSTGKIGMGAGIVGIIQNGIVNNCYSTAEGIGDKILGGIAVIVGEGSSLSNSIALNPSVKMGRVTALNVGTLFYNAAWNGILNNDGNTIWENKGQDKEDGEDMSLEAIYADGTLGGRFTAANGWTTQNGKLPGLFGKPVEMPAHLGGVGIDEQLQVT
ncbi:MAG: hypothetical protein LBU83_08350, partial [Bacteroidales bacterium]|nr:hypothetical protein [Bacteroidales bacterium]